jgi:hypothetical protein
MTNTLASDARVTVATTARPPLWLVLSTAAAALLILLLAVVETSITAAYLVDERGEFISLFGLTFIFLAGLYLWRQGRLYVSLPLVLPWLLYPIVTQGDQIIDNLSINPMRAVCDVLLAAIFAAPVAVLVMIVRAAITRSSDRTRMSSWLAIIPGARLMATGQARRGAAILTAALYVVEIWLAQEYLGSLMVLTLALMTVGALIVASLPEPTIAPVEAKRRSERFALGVLLVGVAVSLGTYVGYKNKPGAYQGSPSFFMDPAQKASSYHFDRIAVPPGTVAASFNASELHDALSVDAKSMNQLFQAYHLLNRQYTYDFHNELFVRHTPLVADYRDKGLRMIAEARQLYNDGDARTARARAALPPSDPLGVFLDEVRAYMAFEFQRAPALEQMSGGFERTKAGLQHAAHLYEGDTKYLGVGLDQILKKYGRVLDAPSVSPVTAEFVATSHRIYEAYASHIVGF